MVGVNNGGGSRITLLDRGGLDEQFPASGASARIPEHEKGTGSERIPLCSLKPVLMIPTTL